MTDSDLVILDHVAQTNSAVRRFLVEHSALRRELLVQADKRAELEQLVARWEALGERHDLKLREPGCKCDQEEGDSTCPVHPDEDELLAQQEPK